MIDDLKTLFCLMLIPIGLLALVMYGIGKLEHAVDRRAESAVLVQADYERCVTVNPGELAPDRGVKLYPNRKRIA